MSDIKNKYKLKNYIGCWVALDNKDRIISINKDYNKVIKAVEHFSMIKRDYFGTRIYQLCDEAIKNAIKLILDD